MKVLNSIKYHLTNTKYEPIDKRTFRKELLIYLFVQALFSIYVYSIVTYNAESFINLANRWIFCLLVIIFTFLILSFFGRIINGRFEDTYQDQELTIGVAFFFGIFPLLIISLVFHLLFLDRSSDFPPKYFSNWKHRLSAFVIVLGLQVFSNGFAFFTAGPSTYNLSVAIHNIQTIMELKNTNRNLSEFVEEYQQEYGEVLTDDELKLLASLSRFTVGRERDRAIASRKGGQNEIELNFGLLHLKHMQKLLEISEDKNRAFSFYSPFHWFYPSGPLEIVIITTLDEVDRINYNKEEVQKICRFISILEKKLSELPDDLKYKYSRDLNQMKVAFSKFK